ncbi:hypothetical protein 1013_scaffold47_00041 [Bacteriophage sp.]|nr:hypothetical protein 1013_scaffold47_00041 [Bacteriophage sp.]
MVSPYCRKTPLSINVFCQINNLNPRAFSTASNFLSTSGFVLNGLYIQLSCCRIASFSGFFASPTSSMKISAEYSTSCPTISFPLILGTTAVLYCVHTCCKNGAFEFSNSLFIFSASPSIVVSLNILAFMLSSSLSCYCLKSSSVLPLPCTVRRHASFHCK